jgi:hypothetical protein
LLLVPLQVRCAAQEGLGTVILAPENLPEAEEAERGALIIKGASWIGEVLMEAMDGESLLNAVAGVWLEFSLECAHACARNPSD